MLGLCAFIAVGVLLVTTLVLAVARVFLYATPEGVVPAADHIPPPGVGWLAALGHVGVVVAIGSVAVLATLFLRQLLVERPSEG